MGILRFYLALCVIATHSDKLFGISMHDGLQAVQIYFIISGFYMQLVLSTKYKEISSFYLNRCLRIYVPYLVTMVAVILFCVGTGMIYNEWIHLTPFVDGSLEQNGLAGVAIAMFSNVAIVFQDIVFFIQDEGGTGLMTTLNPTDKPLALDRLLIMRHCWTISMELMFYALVPMLFRQKTKILAVLIFLSLSARVYAYEVHGLIFDPWHIRFFPFEFALFLLGMVSCRYYLKSEAAKNNTKAQADRSWTNFFIIIGSVVGFSLFTNAISKSLIPAIGLHYSAIVTHGLFFLAIPFIFKYTKDHKYDQFLGELAFPIYLFHWTIFLALKPVLSQWSLSKHWVCEFTSLLSIVCAVILYRWVILPVDRYRHKFVR